MFSKLPPNLRAGLACAFSFLAAPSLAQTTINVGPGQPYTTIQSGINAAVNGDTVLVAAGTYYENINFNGKAITVTSAGGAASTIIDGGGTGPAVLFKTSETRASVLSGFTVQHGGVPNYYTVFVNGGIYLSGSSPTIQNNILTQNNCWTIYSQQSAPLIQNNEISATQDPIGNCTFGGGAGIYIGGNLNGSSVTNNGTSALILHNTIENNVESGLEDAGGNGGAGVAVWAGSPIIMNNIIRNNASPGGSGGAINVEFGEGVAIVQNLIYGNSAGCGGGALAFQGNPDPRTGISILIANNTIANNIDLGFGGYSECIAISQIYPSPDAYGTSNPAVMILNNIISGSTSYPAMNCSWYDSPSESIQPTVQNDILYNADGPFFGSYCVDVSAKYNNLAADPRFNNPSSGDYHLTAVSPAVDSGQNSALQTFENLTGLPFSTDLDGNPRIQNATGMGCIVDMGAYEYPSTQTACLTTETLKSSLNPSDYGQTVTFTAQLSSISGVPSGDVQFTDGTTILGAETISSAGVSTFTISSLAIGSHNITAVYQPTGIFSASSASLTQVVNGYSSTTSLTCSPASIPIAGIALLAASVTSTNGTPTGSIAFTDNGTALVTQSLLSGSTSLAYTGLMAGNHTLTATYVPTGSFAASTASCSEVVTALPTTAVLAITPTLPTYGSPVTLAATVSPVAPPGPSTPTGIVTFYNGAAVIGTGTLVGGVASLTLNNLPGGSNNLTCMYGGNSTYAASNCNTVPAVVSAAPTTLTLTSSSNPAQAGVPIVFTANLSGNGKPASGDVISFTINANGVVQAQGSATTDAYGNAAYRSPGLSPGTYLVSAFFAGTPDLQNASSPALTQVVVINFTSTTLTASPNPGYPGQTIMLTATVAAGFTVAAPIPSGVVTFFDGSNILGTATLSAAGVATLTTTSLAVGTHSLTASYPVNAFFLSSTSSPFAETILNSGFALALSPTTITLASGKSANVAINLASVGLFSGPLTLTYGTLPIYASAAINPSMITLMVGGNASSTLTVNTLSVATNDVPVRPGSAKSPLVFAATFVLLIPFLSRRKRVAKILAVFTAATALQSLTGCTNTWHIANDVAPGTYMIPITATDLNHNSQTTNLTVIVTP